MKNVGALERFLTILHQKENEKNDGNVCSNEFAWKCQKIKNQDGDPVRRHILNELNGNVCRTEWICFQDFRWCLM